MNRLDLTFGVILILAVMLCSCTDMKSKWAREDNDKCSAYGAAKGSAAYVQCRAQLDAARTNAIATYNTIK